MILTPEGDSRIALVDVRGKDAFRDAQHEYVFTAVESAAPATR